MYSERVRLRIVPIVLLLVLLGRPAQAACVDEDAALTVAAARAGALDVQGALAGLERAGVEGCPRAGAATWFLRGLVAAREAYSQGGSDEALAPVRRAVEALDAVAGSQPGPAAIASVVLVAAGAAAQSEREELGAYLGQALSMEALQRAAGQPGAPIVTALELSGDLWLRVHRYEDARKAYEAAARELGATPRITAGLARVAARLDEPVIACAQFRLLLDWWAQRAGQAPPEIDEARMYVVDCGRASTPKMVP